MSLINFKFLTRLINPVPVNTPIADGDRLDVAFNKLQGQIDVKTSVTTLDSLTNVNVPTPNNGDGLIYNTGSGTWIAQAAGGGGTVVNRGTTTVNFTLSPIDNIAITTITGQAWVTATSLIQANIRPQLTSTHSSDEHLMIKEFMTVDVPVSSIVVGVGFDIVASIHDKSLITGEFNVNWTGIA